MNQKSIDHLKNRLMRLNSTYKDTWPKWNNDDLVALQSFLEDIYKAGINGAKAMREAAAHECGDPYDWNDPGSIKGVIASIRSLDPDEVIKNYNPIQDIDNVDYPTQKEEAEFIASILPDNYGEEKEDNETH